MAELTLLDGGMGQELIHRSKNPPSPLWSTQVMMDEAHIVEQVHREYINAGAHYITLNSYSATPERLARDANEDLFEPMQAKAIEIAKAAAQGTTAKIAGCLSPLYGSYQPEFAPDFDTCLATYQRIVECQKAAVDVFLCETMSSIKEAASSTQAAKQSNLPVWCALSVDEDDGTKLRSGEPVLDGAKAAIDAGADAVLINCSPPEQVTKAIKAISSLKVQTGAYANGFQRADTLQLGGTVSHLRARVDLDPDTYADFAQQWIDEGATIIGGCCEVGPAHISKLQQRFF